MCYCYESSIGFSMGNGDLFLVHIWFQPVSSSVWAEQKVFGKLNGLKLAPEQQASVDSGIRID